MTGLPETNQGEARRWLGQAGEDLVAARVLAGSSEVPARAACFHAHLAAEKAMKAWLIWLDRPFRKVHDLRELHTLLPGDVVAAVSEDDLDRLNPWVIEGRYPGDVPEATPEHANECVASAERVVDVVSSAIDNPPAPTGAS